MPEAVDMNLTNVHSGYPSLNLVGRNTKTCCYLLRLSRIEHKRLSITQKTVFNTSCEPFWQTLAERPDRRTRYNVDCLILSHTRHFI